MNASVMLRCEGYQSNGFQHCSIVKNTILNLKDLEYTKNYYELIKYLDNVLGIFDADCNVASKISNAIYKMYQLDYIKEDLHKQIAYFYTMHKRCGMIVYLEYNGEAE